MQKEIEALGAVVAGRCDLHIKSICKYDTEVGALLVFNDGNGNQLNVCKNCSDYMFTKGEWYRKGEKPKSVDAPTSKLKLYVAAMNSASNYEEMLKEAANFSSERWVLSIPISVGEYLDPYFVIEVSLGASGWISIAFESEDESTPAVVKVRPCRSIEELTRSEGAILFVEERIR